MIDFIKDADCTKETPVRLGVPDAPIYGKGIKLKPRVDGRTDSEHFKKIYLPELLPLEEYDIMNSDEFILEVPAELRMRRSRRRKEDIMNSDEFILEVPAELRMRRK